MCDHDPDCDPAFMRKVRDEKIYEREAPDGVPTTATAHPVLEYLLPMAHAAWAPTEHATSMFVRVVTCNYGSCSMSRHVTTTGAYTIDLQPPRIRTSAGDTEAGHATGATVPAVQVTSCATRDIPSTYNYVRAQFDIGVTLLNDQDGRIGCAFVSERNITVSSNPDATWTWTLTGTTGAYIQTR